MQNLINNVKPLVDYELKEANAQFSLFQSTHEGYAIMLEEVEESQTEDEKINDGIEKLWYEVKNNGSKERLNAICEVIKIHAILNAAESIQVAAMAQKFIESSKQWEEK